jgi:tRNA-specific 2-thiouridylase
LKLSSAGAPFLSRCRKTADQSVAEAVRLAKILDIHLEVVEAQSEFQAFVEDPFIHDRLGQWVNSPCFNCHSQFKVGLLLREADRLKIDHVATGHGASIAHDPSLGVYRLLPATNPHQDQSSYLSGLSQAQLSRLEFPLGSLSETIVKRLSVEIDETLGPDQARSQPCLLSEREVEAVMRPRLPSYFHNPGAIRLGSGSIVGEHRGSWQFYPGRVVPPEMQGFTQEKTALVALRLDPEMGSFVAISQQDWPASRWILADLHTVRPFDLFHSLDCKLRLLPGGSSWPQRSAEYVARVLPLEGDRLLVDFGDVRVPLMAGEVIVFESGGEVLGRARAVGHVDRVKTAQGAEDVWGGQKS